MTTAETTAAKPHITLRPYQDLAIAKTRDAWRAGHLGALVVLPTGTGKTQTALSLVASAASKGWRVLWLAHREELLEQPLSAFRGCYGDVARDCGIVQADRDDCAARVVFGSVDTMRIDGRLHRYLAHGAPMLVVADEAHHFPSDTRAKLLDSVDAAAVVERGRPSFRLGLTATPDRADGKSLARQWRLVYAYPLWQAIREGWLVPPVSVIERLPTLDLSKVSGTADYDADELGVEMIRAGVVDHTVSALAKHAADRQTIVFTATVDQAERTAEALRATGVEARWLCGETPREERRRMLRGFLAGSIQVIANAQVLTEGTDLPPVSCIAVARPTRSRPLFAQMIGRGLRLYPGKSECKIIDFVGATDEHRMIVAPILLDELEKEERDATEGRASGGGAEAGKWRHRRPPQAAWVRVPDMDREVWVVDCSKQGMVVVVADGDGWTTTLLKSREGGPVPLVDAPVDRELAIGLGEDVARRSSGLTRGAADWRKRRPTTQQVAMLLRFPGGIEPLLTKIGHPHAFSTDPIDIRAAEVTTLLVQEGAVSGDVANLLSAQLAKRQVAKAGLAKRTDK